MNLFGLVDCNSFYCAAEMLFQPALRGRPVIVLSNNDGCVVSLTKEAKQIGIVRGVPAFEIKELIEQHGVAVFSSNYTLYGNISDRVFHTLSRFTPEIERYSIDEAFLLFSGFEHYDIGEYARHIVNTTIGNTGIPVSMGLAVTKTLAKVANKIAKKDPTAAGVKVLIDQQEIDQVLGDFPVEDLWGIGGRYALKLYSYGIKTAGQFVRLRPDWVQRNLTINGLRMWHELRGKPCIPLEEIAPSKKGICSSRSFGKLQTEQEVIAEAVANFAAVCGRKLREQRSSCRMMQVFINTHPFRQDLPAYCASRTHVFDVPTNSTIEMVASAKRLLNAIFRNGYHYKKAGVLVTDIVPEDQVQMNLFDKIDREKQAKAMRALDLVNGNFGTDIVRLGSMGYQKKWKLRNEMLSPCYTTRLSDLFKIQV